MTIQSIIKKIETAIDRNRAKRLERKRIDGRLGTFVAWGNRMKRPLVESSFNEYGEPWGRLSNKVYKKTGGIFTLYRKFKNATKAKKFMERI